MQVTLATTPADPARPNEDFVAASPDAAVLLDGAGTPMGSESGCTHGVGLVRAATWDDATGLHRHRRHGRACRLPGQGH